MKVPAYLLATLLILATLALTASAKEKNHLPLPPQVLTAKTIYIDNQSGEARIGDRAYDEIKKWGRFQVVTDRKQADLIFLLTAREHTGGYVTTGGNQTGTVDSNGNINTSNSPTYTTPVTVGYTYLAVIDSKTGDNLWSESKRWGNLYTGFHSATKGLIDELKRRISEQSSDSSKK
jgi:hypothetical protein